MLETGEQTIALDGEGYLVDPSDWNEFVAHELARKEGIELTEDHWAVLHFMRTFYEEHQVPADVRHVTKHLAEVRGAGGDNRNLIFTIFPYGYVQQACKIAGMRKPRNWSTG